MAKKNVWNDLLGGIWGAIIAAFVKWLSSQNPELKTKVVAKIKKDANVA